MLIALWVTASATVLLALTSAVAVLTWRENRRRARDQEKRDRDAQQQERTLEAARKEFAGKSEIGSLKNNLSAIGVFAALGALIAWAVRNESKGNRAS